MKTVIILAHPDSTNSHTQQFLLESIANFEDVVVHNIAKGYNIMEDRALLQKSDRILLQFPIYWYSAPAILKEWLDNVWVSELNLANKDLGLVISLGVAEKQFQAGGRENFTISEMLRPFEMLANHFKMNYLPILSIFQFDYMTDEKRKQLLISYQQYVSTTQPLSFASKGKWLIKQLEKEGFTEYLAPLITTIQEKNDELEDVVQALREIKND